MRNSLNRQLTAPVLDVICIGRSSVDLYGGQVGGRLEDMATFNKYVGGSPTNISIGCARLGLKAALITRVGDEHMGRFITESLKREGVDCSHVVRDPEHLTALVILGIRDKEQFPLIFYRENCADMALSEADIDPAFIVSAHAVLVSGTHFSTEQVSNASMAAINHAHAAKRKVVFDIDYRPNLWASGEHDDGASRFAENARATQHLQTILPHCDLIVGTEEEWHIAGGTTDTLDALQNARRLSDAVLVCKRGALGCSAFAGEISAWSNGISAPVKKIEVFNVLGAGDGFMAGFLYGWLRDEELTECCRAANTCGALAVSRHGCAPAYPSEIELRHMLNTGSAEFALRKDRQLEQIHWTTTRPNRRSRLLAFAFDHRSQFLALAQASGRNEAAIDRFKVIALEAVVEVAETHAGAGLGILVDDRLGRTALRRAADHDFWIGRPIEVPDAFPLAFEEGPDLGSKLARWPAGHCVKVLAPLRLDDSAELRTRHEDLLGQLADACRNTGHELLVEIINGREGQPAEEDQIHKLMERLYQLGIYPDWWKLEPLSAPSFWRGASAIVHRHDPHSQGGIIVLGKEMAKESLMKVFAAACAAPQVKGFAIGQTIFRSAAEQWFAGQIDDQAAGRIMGANYRDLIEAWNTAGG